MAGVKEYYALCIDDDGQVCTVCIRTVGGKEFAKERLMREGYKVTEVVDAKNHHICGYCNGIAEGDMEDLLCRDCRELFGHTLYSEL